MKTSQRLISGGALRLIAFVAAVLSTLIVMPVLIRELGNHLYGLWVLIGSIVAYYEFFDLGLGTTTQRYLAKAFQGDSAHAANSIYSTALFIFSILGLFFAFLSVFVASLSSYFFSAPQDIHLFGVCILLLGLNFATKVPFYAVEGAIAAKLRYDIIAATRILIIVLRTGLLVSVVKMGYSLIAIALIMIGLTIVNRLILYVAFRRVAPDLRFAQSAVRRSVSTELINHGKYIFVSNISKNVQFRLLSVIVSSLVDLSSVAIAAIASRLAEYLRMLIDRVFHITIPVFASIDMSKEQKYFHNLFWVVHHLTITFVIAAFGLGAILGPSFIALWLGPGFEASYTIFLILLIGLLPQQLQSTSTQALVGIAQHKWASLSDVVESAMGIFLAITLGYKYGLIGIALGIVMPSMLIKLFLYPLLVCRGLSISLVKYCQVTTSGVAMAAVALVPVYFICEFLKPLNFAEMLLCGFVGLVVSYLVFVLTLPIHYRKFLVTHIPDRVKPFLTLWYGQEV
jgi:O-antigen/teichoic acid export membrane protein